MNIKENIRIILKENNTIEGLINCFELIKQNKDIAIIKFDGERENDNYTIFITFSQSKNMQMIRTDCSDLKQGMNEILEKYIKDL